MNKINLVNDPKIRELFKETLEVCETEEQIDRFYSILDNHLEKYNN